MSLIAIGDIHGCIRSLEQLIEDLNLQADDHLVFIGDYIDRGPGSKDVIDFLINLAKTQKCTFLRGNHESMMLNYLNLNEIDLWEINGGRATLMGYVDDGKIVIPDDHIAFLKNTGLFLDTEDFFFVHAGIKHQWTIQENIMLNNEDIFLWERSHLSVDEYAWEKPVVCGHTPQKTPLIKDKLICIDTGCVFGNHPDYGYLTAIRLPEREVIAVKSLD